MRRNKVLQEENLQPDPLWDKRLAARYLRISVQTLDRWRTEGRGPKWLKVGSQVRYRATDVEAYLAECVGGEAA
jgi:excisionase family DNA binding protein